MMAPILFPGQCIVIFEDGTQNPYCINYSHHVRLIEWEKPVAFLLRIKTLKPTMIIGMDFSNESPTIYSEQNNDGTFTVICSYKQVDENGNVFMPGCFDKSLKRKNGLLP